PLRARIADGELALPAPPELILEELRSGRLLVDDENLLRRDAFAPELLQHARQRVSLAAHDGDVERVARELVHDCTKIRVPAQEACLRNDRRLEAPIEIRRQCRHAAAGRTSGHRLHLGASVRAARTRSSRSRGLRSAYLL